MMPSLVEAAIYSARQPQVSALRAALKEAHPMEPSRPSSAPYASSLLFVVAVCVTLPAIGAAQTLTGALVGTVKDQQGLLSRGAWFESPPRH